MQFQLMIFSRRSFIRGTTVALALAYTATPVMSIIITELGMCPWCSLQSSLYSAVTEGLLTRQSVYSTN